MPMVVGMEQAPRWVVVAAGNAADNYDNNNGVGNNDDAGSINNVNCGNNNNCSSNDNKEMATTTSVALERVAPAVELQWWQWRWH